MPPLTICSVVERRVRARAYLAEMGPAFQGQHGDDHTYKAGCVLLVDFALPFDIALEEFRAWNETCQPPWSERDLIAKLQGAAKYGRHALGGKLKETKQQMTACDTADELLDFFLAALADPIDPERTARFRAQFGIISEPDPAGDLRDRKRLLTMLLADADVLLPWKQAARKGRPDPRKIPRDYRHAALLAALGAYLAAGEQLDGEERIDWIMGQAAREHFACFPPSGPARDEIPFIHNALDAMAMPQARDGHGRAQPLSADIEESRPAHSRLIHPRAQFPDDPETICARDEAVEQFGASLSPLEQRVFDEPFGDPEAAVAKRAGTTEKTVHSTRQRIRKRARAWGDAANEPARGVA
jgi:hypothetical protein